MMVPISLRVAVATMTIVSAQANAQMAPAVPAPDTGGKGGADRTADPSASQSVAADAGAAAGPGARGSDSGLEEIIVTAQRRSENSQSVPISITALSALALQRSGVAQTSDLQVVTPGLVWSVAAAVPTPFIRGVGSRDPSATNESGVATYVDGVYYAAMPAALLALPNIERIEVLKGPQGTLFGRNANGGLIQIITRDPPSMFSGKASVSYANYDTISGTGYLGGPLAEKLSADLALYYTDQHHGWGKNLNNGAEANLTKDAAIRAKLLFKPGDATRILLAGDYSRRRSDLGNSLNIVEGTTSADGKCGIAPFPAGYPGCSPRPASTFRGTIYDTQNDAYGSSGKNGAEKAGTDQGGFSLNVEHEFDFALFHSLSSYRKVRGYVTADQEGSNLPISTIHISQYDRTFTQELQISSQSQSAFTWIVGTFFMRRNAGYDPFNVVGYSIGLASPLDPAGQYGAPPAYGGSFDVFTNVLTNSYSGYAQATVEFLSGTHLTAGARYTSDHDHLTSRQIDARAVLRASADTKETFSKLTYRLSLDHHFSSTGLAYISYNRGFKAGLFNASTSNGTFSTPETLDALEAGIKADFLDNHVRANIAAFHYDYKDIQLPIIVGGSVRTINAARAKLNGLDFDLQVTPVRGLTLRSGGSFLFKAEYTNFPNGPLYTPNGAGFNQTAADLSGNRMIRAPRFSGNLSADYTADTSVGSFGTSATYYHNSGFYWSLDDRFKQPRFGVLNSQVSWTSLDKKYVIRGWTRNLLNKKYFSNYGLSTVGLVAVPAEPRTYGLTAEITF